MKSLVGEYECKLDTKNRIGLPAALLKQLSHEEKQRFVINRGIERHLVLYPGPEWDIISAKVNALDDFMAKQRQFARRFHSGTAELILDSQQRVLLPRRLLDYARIEDRIILAARARKIEVWSATLYDQMFEDGADDDFSKLAEEVMGDRIIIPLTQD